MTTCQSDSLSPLWMKQKILAPYCIVSDSHQHYSTVPIRSKSHKLISRLLKPKILGLGDIWQLQITQNIHVPARSPTSSAHSQMVLVYKELKGFRSAIVLKTLIWIICKNASFVKVLTTFFSYDWMFAMPFGVIDLVRGIWTLLKTNGTLGILSVCTSAAYVNLACWQTIDKPREPAPSAWKIEQE